jgi:hypothetical protein
MLAVKFSVLQQNLHAMLGITTTNVNNRIPNSNCVIIGHGKETEIALIFIVA